MPNTLQTIDRSCKYGMIGLALISVGAGIGYIIGRHDNAPRDIYERTILGDKREFLTTCSLSGFEEIPFVKIEPGHFRRVDKVNEAETKTLSDKLMVTIPVEKQ